VCTAIRLAAYEREQQYSGFFLYNLQNEILYNSCADSEGEYTRLLDVKRVSRAFLEQYNFPKLISTPSSNILE